MTATPQLEAKKHALRQNQDGGWRLTLNTQPDDKMPAWLMDGAPGLRLYVTIEDAEQFDNETSPRSAHATPARPAEASGESRATPAGAGREPKRKPLSPGSRAALMCKDPRAWPVIMAAVKRWRPGAAVDIQDEQFAAAWLREICDVDSRRDLTDDNRVWGTVSAEYERVIGKIGP